MTELCELGKKWGTDKFILYTPFYHELLKDRRDIKKVLEFGIGSPEDLKDSLALVGAKGHTMGASLYMWRDYFPQAEIFALDYKEEKFVNEDRIHSFYCDQGSDASYEEAKKKIGDGFDLIIEDGGHYQHLQLTAMRNLMPLLKENGIYIMEDIGAPPHDWVNSNNIPYPHELKTFYRADIPNDRGRSAIVVLRKK